MNRDVSSIRHADPSQILTRQNSPGRLNAEVQDGRPIGKPMLDDPPSGGMSDGGLA
jgi:hypothetical protein